MTMKIEVTIPEDDIRNATASAYIASALSAIGFTRPPKVDWRVALGADEPVAEQPLSPDAEAMPDEGPNYAAMKAAADAAPAPEAPKRERGKPSPGRARRTKEEIAEDEAADKADAAAPVPEPVALISTGEERIDPTSPEDAAQDAADEAAEAAEAEAAKAPELTHDDVRAAVTAYTTKYGIAATMEDLMTGLGLKVDKIPADKIGAALAEITRISAEDLFVRGREGTKEDVMAALLDYALKYDGQNKTKTLEAMPNTMADGKALLTEMFGAGVHTASQIPASPENYATAARRVRYAIYSNPFKREAQL